MFSSRLDSPPPPQTLPYHKPRPWSPDPYGPLPALSSVVNTGHTSDDPYNTSVPLARQRREASEASIEALDLADYARTLRTRQPGDPYPDIQDGALFSRPQHTQDSFQSYPPVSFVPQARASRDSLSPPSLVSRGATLSSNGTHSTSRGGRRPFSLPTPNSSTHALRSHYPQPRIVEPQPTYPGAPPSEIDIAQFPAWSRSWYQPPNRANEYSPPPIDDFYTAIPPSHFNPTKKPSKSVFDPDYVHYDQNYYPRTDPSSLSDPVFAPPSSMGHDSTRGLLPWSHSDNSASVDPSTKEERMRMLEREFGPNSGKGNNRSNGDFVDEDGKPLIGTVDQNGYLVTQGPRKRIALRVLQVLFALGSGVPAIYAAVVIKPNPPAPPAGTASAYALYVLSILTFLALLYLFLLRPCCFNPRRKDKGLMDNPLAGGMMVLPVPNSGNKKNKGKKPKKGVGGGGKGMGDSGDVQVNLIVDPHVFSGGRDDEDSDDDDEGNDVLPGGYYGVGGGGPGSGAGGRGKRRRNKRRSVFAGLAMEAEWKRARAWAKKIAFIDAAGVIIWGAVFVIVLIGKRCPSGGFDGW
ncbi:hypothetical protein D9756_001306 [Leucocoprinus leucothites]|uniref:Uncharacterized protein n=1 Tax=Leucocoprinus leucothites TaxID=201217 RepID=A0A8H5LIF5_9AGAR|nr:hypothetical protein D9756_001306 [Leucoagaricus leucothites]